MLFPRSCISYGRPYTRVAALRITPSRIIATVAEGVAENDSGFVYELNYKLRVIAVSPTDVGVPQLRKELEARHILDHPFSTQAECERLKAGLIVRRRFIVRVLRTVLAMRAEVP